jgi:hypothetical protein
MRGGSEVAIPPGGVIEADQRHQIGMSSSAGRDSLQG